MHDIQYESAIGADLAHINMLLCELLSKRLDSSPIARTSENELEPRLKLAPCYSHKCWPAKLMRECHQ